MRQRPWIKQISPTEVDVDCRECNKRYVVKVTKDQVDRWLAGELIQEAMPEVNNDYRELLISGTCPTCWDKLFGG